MYLLSLVPCEIYPTSNTFYDAIILTYQSQLPPSGNKIGFNLLGDEYFTIHYITDTIPNLTPDNQPPTQAKKNVLIVAINGKESIT